MCAALSRKGRQVHRQIAKHHGMQLKPDGICQLSWIQAVKEGVYNDSVTHWQ